MILFIASEVMFFSAFFWAFFDASLFPGDAMQVARSEHTGGVWPPVGVEVFDAFHLPFLNTMILLLSGCTVTWAHHALIHGDRQGLLQGLALTVLLGALFTSIQAYEYSRSEEHTSELQSLMRISYAVFCLKKKNTHRNNKT